MFRVPYFSLIMLALQMSTFQVNQFDMSISQQQVGQSILKKGGLFLPGHRVEERKFWQKTIQSYFHLTFYSIIATDPETMYKVLNSRGIDAQMGIIQLDMVESPIGSSYQYPNSTLAQFKKCQFIQLIFMRFCIYQFIRMQIQNLFNII